MMLLLVPYTNSSAQSTDKNYIQTKTYLDENASSFLRHIDYYDELGFVSETVDVGVNTSGTPMVTRTEYNCHVKPHMEWLPIPSTSLDYISDVENAAWNTYNDIDAYKWNWYDDFDRLSHTWKPGYDWDEHFAVVSYKVVPSGLVKRYSVSDNGVLSENGTYPYGVLTCTTTTDEDGRTMTVFTNLHEETIMERRGTGNDTYYVYDSYGRLCYVLPPMCQQCSSTDRQKYWYKYTYDDRGRCTGKQLPGCTEVTYWYDDANRILSMQDTILQEASYYRNYAYDAIGRMTLQTLSRSQGEANLSNAEIVEVRNFYDRASFVSEIADMFPEWADSINTFQIDDIVARGKRLATLQTTSNENYYLDMFSYDAKGRMTYRLGAYTDLWMKIDHKSYNFIGDVTNIEEHVYKYDRTISHLAGRRTSQSYKSGTRLPAITTLSCIDRSGNHTASRINNLTYDVFGNVVGNDRPGQYADITYTYDNLHGWLSGISSPCGFSELLKRETAATPQYGGNIGTAIWRNTHNGEQHRYDFTYDALGRLTESQYSSSVNANSGHFNEIVEYNCQGAITSLLRYGMKNNGTFGIIDDLSISYDGNRLLSVTDDAEPVNYNGALDFNDGADLNVEYEYNAVGALVRDSNRGINGITYDFCQYPKIINMGNNMREISYDYTPDGRKLYCRHTTRIAGVSSNTMNTITDTYIDGLILRDGSPLMWQFDGGYVALNASAAPTSWNYYISDHLGSTRMVVTSTNTIKETINYYPYGSEMRMTDPAQMTNTSNKERFRFSGKELDFQNGLNMYDFGARMFDVAGIPFWTSMDPLAEDNCHVTPYSYCNGDPVNRIDPDGRFFTDFNDENGKLVNHIEDGSNATFQQTGKGIYKHYEFSGFDNNQGGENKIDITSAIQEQQKLNDSNPYLQEHNGATYCNFATQNIMKTVASATNDNGAVVTGVANVMISSLKNGSNNNYEVVDYQTAADNAREGGLSIVGYSNPNGHGHLATFAVGENINPKHKETIANIGPKAYSGFVTLNMAISSKKAKTFFIYKTPNFQK